MFISNEWKSSKFGKQSEVKEVENLVVDSSLWWGIITCLKASFPLIKVLRLVDAKKRPAIGFIYEAMHAAKEKIKSNFNNIKRR